MPDLSPETIDRLVEAASEVRKKAHAPYSSFAVGAAVLDTEGRIHVGCNVENASYGLSVCAERHAVAAAVSASGQEIEGLAVVTDTSPPTSPCGACTSVGDLLPDAFTPESLVKG